MAAAQVFMSSCFVFIAFISGCASGDYVVPVVSPNSALLMPGQTVQFGATSNEAPLANPIWLVNNVAGGTASTGTISSTGLYVAPSASTPAKVQVSVKDPEYNSQSLPAQVSFFQENQSPAGTVSGSKSPQVATYDIDAPQGATVQIQFGTTTNYGLTTWAQQAPLGGGNVDMLVAGMRASTPYHMQALIHLPNGNTAVDSDHVFTTGALAPNLLPNLTFPQTAGANVASGIELLCLFDNASPNPESSSNTALTALVTDLEGNVIWYYPIQPSSPYPMKLLPNGHMLVVTYGSNQSGVINAVQEIDLAGNIIYQISQADVQQGLAAAGLSFPQIGSFHHDVLKLPNGHFILLVNFNQNVTDVPGVSTVTADAVIDWDPQRGPVWTWSTLDHIPHTRAPYGYPDWTHANALVYSPDDGNLLLSMRNQNWIVKINYQNGEGDGSILWHFGVDGDFTLSAGDAPIEWNYGQHYPVFLGPNTAGVYSLMFFNNGNNRLINASNQICGGTGVTPCYSSVPIFQLNEYTKTAQVLWEDKLTPAYSICCGNVNQLSNSDLEWDVAYDLNTPNVSYIQEVTQEQTPQLLWQMNITGQLAYRGFRIPSLYPGVEWTQSAIAAANATPNASSSSQTARKSSAK